MMSNQTRDKEFLKSRRKSTPLKRGALPSTFVAFAFFFIFASVDPARDFLIMDLFDTVIVWWMSTLFLVTMKDSLMRREGSDVE